VAFDWRRNTKSDWQLVAAVLVQNGAHEHFALFRSVLPPNRLPHFAIAVFSNIRRWAYGVRGCLLADDYLALVS